MVELSTRISCFRRVYKPSKLTSEVRIVVSRFSALKKWARMPPKPQSVSSERTAKGKASRFFLSGIVSVLNFSACAGAQTWYSKMKRQTLYIYIGVIPDSRRKIRRAVIPLY